MPWLWGSPRVSNPRGSCGSSGGVTQLWAQTANRCQLHLPRTHTRSCRAAAPAPGGAELCAAAPSWLLWCHTRVCWPQELLPHSSSHTCPLCTTERHKHLQRTGYKACRLNSNNQLLPKATNPPKTSDSKPKQKTARSPFNSPAL